VPDIIYPNENTENVWFQVETIFVPTSIEIGDLIPGDSAIVNLQPQRSMISQNASGCMGRIANPEGSRIIRFLSLFVTAGISDGVALKEYGTPLSEFYFFCGCPAFRKYSGGSSSSGTGSEKGSTIGHVVVMPQSAESGKAQSRPLDASPSV
jgi:hypothetical protein